MTLSRKVTLHHTNIMHTSNVHAYIIHPYIAVKTSRALTALLRMHEAHALSEPGDKDILVALAGIAFCIGAL